MAIEQIVTNKNEVFITQSNLLRIVKETGIKADLRKFDDLYRSDELKKIFSIPERNLMLIFHEVFQDPNILNECFDKQKTPKDTKRWVFEGAIPAYHADANCQRLSQDFINLEIPPEIKLRGNDEINKFRQFVKSNLTLLDNDEEKFLTRLEAQFFLKNKPNKIKAENTGITKFINYELEDIKRAIDELLIDAREFRNKDIETQKIIKNRTFGTHRINGQADKGSCIEIWRDKYKEPLKALIYTYFRVKFNPVLTFDGKLLDQLGFKPCSCCSK